MKVIIKERIKEIERIIPINQIIYGYKFANEKQEILFQEYLLLKQLYDLYNSSEYRVVVGDSKWKKGIRLKKPYAYNII